MMTATGSCRHWQRAVALLSTVAWFVLSGVFCGEESPTGNTDDTSLESGAVTIVTPAVDGDTLTLSSLRVAWSYDGADSAGVTFVAALCGAAADCTLLSAPAGAGGLTFDSSLAAAMAGGEIETRVGAVLAAGDTVWSGTRTAWLAAPAVPASPIRITRPALQGDTCVNVGFTVVWEYDTAAAPARSFALYARDAGGLWQLVSWWGKRNYEVLDSSFLAAYPTEVTVRAGVALLSGDTLWSAQRTVKLRTTRPGEDVVVIFPSGGERINGNDEWSIRWWALERVAPSVVLLVSSDDGRNYENLVDSEVGIESEWWGDFPVEPGALKDPTASYRIRIESYTDSDKFDASDARFTACAGVCP